MMNAMNWGLVYLASEWAIRFAMLFYVPQRRSAAASRSWLLLIFFLPWPGLIFYALFGRIHLSRKRVEQQQRASRHIRAVQAQMRSRLPATVAELPEKLLPIASLATNLGDLEPNAGNLVELSSDYQGSIDRLIADIVQARDHVHLLYYIYGNDATGQRVAEALIQAANRGISCRVLMDAVGSKQALKTLAPRLRANGIAVEPMLPVGFLRRSSGRFDLRNHRKLVVIDGRIGYTGSQNIVDEEFVCGFPNEEIVVRVAGPLVGQFQAVFLADYYFETGQRVERLEMFPDLPIAGQTLAQLVPSGPGYGRENGQELMVELLYAARRRVVITTPYFVPDEPFLLAVRSAARRGVAVDLVVSAHANQFITQLAQRSYYDELLQAGVTIHLYKLRFLHAKHLTIDEDVALIGSSNIDIRSFALNAEINLLLYDPKVVSQLREIQQHYFANSDVLTAKEWQDRPASVRALQNMARLLDSFL
jgi:cardiolipin synthase